MTFGKWQGLQAYDHRMTRPPPPIARGTCRWCAGPLSALARLRGDVCDAMDCRRRDADARAQAHMAAHLDAVRAAAARSWDAPALASAPVLWLRDHADDFAPPAASDIADLRDHLLALADDASAPLREGDDVTATSSLDAALCALCRGRCCRFGLDGRAFLEARQLRDWLSQRPGAAWADAVDHYLGLVASEHLHSSCLFHGRDGCALPRERRSDVCNRFACRTLEQARDIAGRTVDAVDAVVVVGIVASHALRGAAVVSVQGSRALPGLEGDSEA